MGAKGQQERRQDLPALKDGDLFGVGGKSLASIQRLFIVLLGCSCLIFSGALLAKVFDIGIKRTDIEESFFK